LLERPQVVGSAGMPPALVLVPGGRPGLSRVMVDGVGDEVEEGLGLVVGQREDEANGHQWASCSTFARARSRMVVARTRKSRRSGSGTLAKHLHPPLVCWPPGGPKTQLPSEQGNVPPTSSQPCRRSCATTSSRTKRGPAGFTGT